MAEVIGFTLAVLPLLISAAEHYEDILQPFVRYRNFSSKVDRFQQHLRIRRTIFRNECRILLESVVEHDIALRMLEDRDHPQWLDQSVDNRLLKQLDSSKDACITIITQIEEQLRNVDKDSQDFEAAVLQSGQGSIGDGAWRSRVGKKLKFSFSRSKLDSTLADLKALNDDFRTLSSQTTRLDAEVAKEITPITIFKQAPQSVFTPLSLFHDSGLGSSVPTMRAYAASTASHTSFVSSIATDGTSALRVPPTPKEVQAGEPFKCEICGHILSKIKNRVDWKIHIFADLQPYICTFEACEKKLVKFPTRKMWAEHEFTEHRVLRSWCCSECKSFSAAHDLDVHLKIHHSEAFTPAQLPMVLSAAETRRTLPIQIQECPLCKVVPGTSQRNFVKHVGRHLEAIALATLPREIDDDSDQGSVASNDGSQPPPGLDFPVPSPSPPFFVPPDFCHRTSLDGRDRELKLLDQKLFKERRQNVTAPVLVHGEPGSGKTELVERYIQLNRTKFTGGVFWINYRSVEEVHHVLKCIALEYMTDYSPGPDIDLAALMVAVENWFEGFGNWLIILNDLPVWGNLTTFPGIAGARMFCPFRQQSSLIYISSSDRIQNSILPLKPDSLLVAPLGDIRDSSLELNIARSSTGKYQTSSIELGPTRHIPSGSGAIRPYTCKLLECRNLEGFTYPGGLRQHQRQVHLVTESDEDVTLGMARRLRSGNTKSTTKSCDVNCKYHEFGWASEKVRDRHVQEAHMLSPPMYKSIMEHHPLPTVDDGYQPPVQLKDYHFLAKMPEANTEDNQAPLKCAASSVECEICEKIFTGTSAVSNCRRHKTAKHENRERPDCPLCGATFSRRDYLNVHFEKNCPLRPRRKVGGSPSAVSIKRYCNEFTEKLEPAGGPLDYTVLTRPTAEHESQLAFGEDSYTMSYPLQYPILPSEFPKYQAEISLHADPGDAFTALDSDQAVQIGEHAGQEGWMRMESGKRGVGKKRGRSVLRSDSYEYAPLPDGDSWSARLGRGSREPSVVGAAWGMKRGRTGALDSDLQAGHQRRESRVRDELSDSHLYVHAQLRAPSEENTRRSVAAPAVELKTWDRRDFAILRDR